MNIIRLLCPFLTIIFLANSLFAQEVVSLSYEKIAYNENERPSIVAMIEPEAKTVKKAFKDYLKDEYGFKLKGIGFLANKDVLSAKEIQLDKLSEKRINFYAKVVESKERTKMNVFATFGYDVNLSEEQYPKEFGQLEDIVVKFLNDYILKYYEEQVATAAEALAELQEEKSEQQKTIEDNGKEIEDLKKTIQKLEKENKDLAEKMEKNTDGLIEAETRLNQLKEKKETATKALKKLKS